MGGLSQVNGDQVDRSARWRRAVVAVTAVVLGPILFGSAGAAAPASATLRGTVTWTGGPDNRGTVAVGACPIDEQAPTCPSLRVASVAADGSYALGLPFDGPRRWNVAAFVTAGSSFIAGPMTTVDLPRSPRSSVPLTVAARVVGVTVVDGEGAAFPTGSAAVMAFPSGGGDMLVFSADDDGHAVTLLDPAVEYEFTAFAMNTGWPTPWISPDGTEFHFSPPLTAFGADLPEGTTFTVARPVGTLVRVLDGDGQPFPLGTAAVMATPTAGGDMLVFGADGDGETLVDLDPAVEYTVTGFALNTGWPDPWVSPDGTEFHFSDPLTILGADLAEGTTLVVANPATTGTLVHVLDGNGTPFALGTAAVMAIPTGGGNMIVAGADSAGDARIVLDPSVEYEVSAFATGTGWPDPWIAPDGTEFHFSPMITILGADLAEDATFVVARPPE